MMSMEVGGYDAGSLYMLSRLKGIETILSISAISFCLISLYMLSRLKGMENGSQPSGTIGFQ